MTFKKIIFQFLILVNLVFAENPLKNANVKSYPHDKDGKTNILDLGNGPLYEIKGILVQEISSPIKIGKSIPEAIVYLKSNTNEILFQTQSNSKGEFSFRIPKSDFLDSRWLEIRDSKNILKKIKLNTNNLADLDLKELYINK